MDYSTIATAAKDKARDILRGQMAVRIQECVSNAAADLTAAVRAYAVMLRKQAKEDKDTTTSNQEKIDKRAAFDAILLAVPGIDAVTLKAAQDAVTADRAEEDKEAATAAADAVEARKSSVDAATDRIKKTQDALKHAQDNLAKVNSGELKVDLDELNALAQKLIEDHATSPDETV